MLHEPRVTELTEDRYRGRVFATEWLLVMGADTISILAASILLEWQVITLRANIALFALLMLVSGLLWLRIIVPREQSRPIEEA